MSKRGRRARKRASKAQDAAPSVVPPATAPTPSPQPATSFPGFLHLPVELQHHILDMAVENRRPHKRLPRRLKISLVSKDLRAWAVKKLFPSSWTMGADDTVLAVLDIWRQAPTVGKCIKRIKMEGKESGWRTAGSIVEKLMALVPNLAHLSIREWHHLELQYFTSSSRLVSLQLQCESFGFWHEVGALPHLETLTLLIKEVKWSDVDRASLSSFFLPSTLPRLSELVLLARSAPIGFCSRYSLYVCGQKTFDPYDEEDLYLYDEVFHLQSVFARILPQLRLVEQFLVPANLIVFPPSTLILHTLPLPLTDESDSVWAALSKFQSTVPSLLVKHLRIVYRSPDTSEMLRSADLADVVLAHPLLAKLETAILPSALLAQKPSLDAQLKQRGIRTIYETGVLPNWSDDVEPSETWRKICRGEM
ncbi:hypothetical protein JCM10213_005657 [Rhodosporidiobolus nylandii]